MSKKDKSLPKPPSTPFGRKRSFGENERTEPLMADQMAMAMSEGKLDEFLEKEMPGNEHARKLAEMMMGMTGMMPSEGFSEKPLPQKKEPSGKSEPLQQKDQTSAGQPPDEVVHAVKNADVEGLTALLKKEHNKRQGTEDQESGETQKASAPPSGQAGLEKEILERVINIASDNNLSMDWIIFRALKRYVEEYEKSGNL